MNKFLLASSLAGVMAASALAGTVSYNTNTTTLSCNGVAGCTPVIPGQSVTIGGLTLTYNAGSGTVNANPGSFINLGNITTSGTGTNVSMTGLQLIIRVTSTPPSSTGAIPVGAISGSLSTNGSTTSITWSTGFITSPVFGSLPGVQIGNTSAGAFIYQVQQTTLALQSPTDGTPAGQTSIQGNVTDVTPSATPEPTTLVLMGAGLGLVGMLRRRAVR